MKSKTEEIDFSSITHTSDFSFVPYSEYWRQYLGFAVLALAGVVIGFIFSTTLFFMGVVGFALVYFGNKISTKKRAVFLQFAAQNGWKYDLQVSAAVPTGIRWAGHSASREDTVSGEFAGAKFILYKYTYRTGSGKNQSAHPTTVIEIQLNNNFPYMLLDSSSNNRGAVHIPKTAQKISLEGDFHKYFHLYVQEGEHIEALSVISPDVMQTVLDSGSPYDIEIYKDKLYLYAEGDHRSAGQIQRLFKGAEKVIAEISHRAKTFQTESVISELQESSMKTIRILDFGTNPSVARGLEIARIVFMAVALLMVIIIMASIFSNLQRLNF